MAVKAKTVVQAVIVGLLLLIIWNLWSRPSNFVLAPSDLVTSGARGGPATIFDIEPSLQCTPGPSDKADYYTRGLTPGGLCGGMDFVNKQQREYSIMGGIGGPLMEK